jgi:hypothetical protein
MPKQILIRFLRKHRISILTLAIFIGVGCSTGQHDESNKRILASDHASEKNIPEMSPFATVNFPKNLSSLESLPFELQELIFEKLSNLELKNLLKTSPILKKRIESWGFHNDLVKVESFKQLEMNYVKQTRLLKVEFSEKIGKDDLFKSFVDQRLRQVEKLFTPNGIDGLTPRDVARLNKFGYSLSDFVDFHGVTFFPKAGKVVFTASKNPNAEGPIQLDYNSVFDFKTGSLTEGTELWSLQRSYFNDSRVVMNFNGPLNLWNPENGSVVTTPVISSHRDSLLISPSGGAVAVSTNLGAMSGRVDIKNLETGALIHTLNPEDPGLAGLGIQRLRSKMFSPGGTRLLTYGFFNALGKAVQLWNVQTGQLLYSYSQVPQLGEFEQGIFSPDGSKVALSMIEGKVVILNALTGEKLKSFSKNIGGRQFGGSQFFPDNRRIISFIKEDKGGAVIWDTETGKRIKTLKNMSAFERIGSNEVCAFSSDGTKLLTVAKNGIVTILDTQSWEIVHQVDVLEGFRSQRLWAFEASFSPDNTKVIALFSPFGSRVLPPWYDHGQVWIVGGILRQYDEKMSKKMSNRGLLSKALDRISLIFKKGLAR